MDSTALKCIRRRICSRDVHGFAKGRTGDPVEPALIRRDPTDPGKTDLTDKTGTEAAEKFQL